MHCPMSNVIIFKLLLQLNIFKKVVKVFSQLKRGKLLALHAQKVKSPFIIRFPASKCTCLKGNLPHLNAFFLMKLTFRL